MSNTLGSFIEKENYMYIPTLGKHYKSIEKPLWWQLKNLSYTATGYGRKIPTTKMLCMNNRLYRIYCCIFSNSGTCFICSQGKELIVVD